MGRNIHNSFSWVKGLGIKIFLKKPIHCRQENSKGSKIMSGLDPLSGKYWPCMQ